MDAGARKKRGAVKRIIKSSLGAAGFFAPTFNGRAVVLTYHQVVPADQFRKDDPFAAMTVTDVVFNDHLQFLARHFNLLSEAEFIAWLDAGAPASCKRPAVITFDDGWRDNYDTALPILQAAGVPASLFVSTGHIRSGKTFWWRSIEHAYRIHGAKAFLGMLAEISREANADDRDAFSFVDFPTNSINALLERMKALPPDLLRSLTDHIVRQSPPAQRDVLTWDELETMANAGVTIGPHTHNHAILPTASDPEKRDEIHRSVDELKQRGLLTSRFFCFPNGDHDGPSRTAVRDAGFSYAYALGSRLARRRTDARLTVVPRINIGMHNAGDRNAFAWTLQRAALRG